LKAINDSASRI